MSIVLDIETELFTDEFQEATDKRTRLRLAPQPRIACVYVIEDQKYLFFTPDRFSELHKLLRRAKEIITYNGERFDLLVLRKFLKVGKRALSKAKSFDLFSHVSRAAGFRVSLDNLARLNLGKGKKMKGKVLATAPLKKLKAGCRSDVSQTYQLWKKYIAGTLKVPSKDDYETSIVTCPKCGQTPSPDWEHMSEGEMAEHIAWTLGGGFCPFCEHPIS